ncbi:hypothetical protein Gorai_021382 [Gossypium raimondii]|uniref:Uncharacterized protein n=1 Tax=Gossypium raimondii TaxID=29730 RepID=A0A7J8NQ59_GOSRA|nr:hypothetical protein [Gossypium raimondii]
MSNHNLMFTRIWHSAKLKRGLILQLRIH